MAISSSRTRIVVHIRWILPRDMLRVSLIEKEVFLSPWTIADTLIHLRTRNCIGMVAEGGLEGEDILGWMIYHLLSTELQIVRFSVSQPFRRRGIGTQMLKKLFGKLHKDRRSSVFISPTEFHEGAIPFFLANDFRQIGPGPLLTSGQLSVLSSLPNGVAQDYLGENGIDRFVLSRGMQKRKQGKTR